MHFWQPIPLTSRRHIYGTVTGITGREGGFVTFHLSDAVVVDAEYGERSASPSGRWKHRDSLNWTWEVVSP